MNKREYKTKNYVPNRDKLIENREQGVTRAQELVKIREKLQLRVQEFSELLKIPRATYYYNTKVCSLDILKRAKRLLYKVEKSGEPHPLSVSDEYLEKVIELTNTRSPHMVEIEKGTGIKASTMRAFRCQASKTKNPNYRQYKLIKEFVENYRKENPEHIADVIKGMTNKNV